MVRDTGSRKNTAHIGIAILANIAGWTVLASVKGTGDSRKGAAIPFRESEEPQCQFCMLHAAFNGHFKLYGAGHNKAAAALAHSSIRMIY